jgi:2-polyprenyl-3-methyl-5-hydroxy-6-metoxy-1,4-benzoquinol methylase
MSRGVEPVDDAILDEQLAYYRARASEYDDWFMRRGRFDRGADATARWRDEVEEVRGWLGSLELRGKDVLELAVGTGLWTAELLARGASVTAVDAAPEMLDQLERRLPATSITAIEADLFSWAPPREFDVVVSCFFMSHVPDERFDQFLALVAAAMRAGGQVFLLDSARTELSTAADHTLPIEGDQTMTRRLEDGRTFTIVKRFRTDEELATACARQGLMVTVRQTATYFQVASSLPA